MIQLAAVAKHHLQGDHTVRALRGVTLSFQPGEFIGITGPSGSGKSTLLNILGLSEAPSSGTVILADEQIDYQNEPRLVYLRRHLLGYVFQSFNLLAALTATENVAVSLMLNGASYTAACEEAKQLLSRAGLGHRLQHLPSNLSGGEMQRVAVCRAVIHRPRVILADEPTGNLDSVTGDSILTLLKEYAGENTVVVMATHSERALQWCTRHVELRDGQVVTCT